MGGILVLLLGLGGSVSGGQTFSQFITYGGYMIGGGIFLNILWLLPRILKI